MDKVFVNMIEYIRLIVLDAKLPPFHQSCEIDSFSILFYTEKEKHFSEVTERRHSSQPCRIVSAVTEGDCFEDVYLIKKGLLGFLSGNFLAHFVKLFSASKQINGRWPGDKKLSKHDEKINKDDKYEAFFAIRPEK